MKSPPEEKLLRLIRGQQERPQASPQASGGPHAATVAMSDLSPRTQGIRWVKPVVGGLVLVLAVEVAWLILEAAHPLPSVDMPVIAKPSAESPAPPAGPSPEEIPSLATSASRSLFTASADVSASSPTPRPRQGAASKLLASRLSLMGIVPGDPAQAIIEDSETKKTYFVTTGQAVVEGAVLEQVLDHHVILDLEGEKIDLTL
ncbi:MAG: hypothetical protein HYY90_04480 [Candidatus Omnitrophica bacterium]|nr:hypothetical protein [Candidatus Omnitrophota bacterium]